MELVQPALGLVFWMTICFAILFLLLKKLAWKPILKLIRERESSIEDALASAERAKREMAELKASNERIIEEAKSERDRLLKEARDTKDAIISEAKAKAQKEVDRLLSTARENIQNEKNAAIAELKNQVATLSIEIAEKILKEHLSSDDKQKALIKNLMQDVNLN